MINSKTFIIYSYTGIFLISLGIILFIFSVKSLGSSISPLPEPKKDVKLIRTGSYKFLRHPLYSSLILISIGITFYKASLLHFLLLISLSILVKYKAKREEFKLRKIHPEYEEYMKYTIAIIPFFGFLDWRN